MPISSVLGERLSMVKKMSVFSDLSIGEYTEMCIDHQKPDMGIGQTFWR
jgi:hypothetical protein